MKIRYPQPGSKWALAGALAMTVTLVANNALARQVYYDAIFAETGTCIDCRLCHNGPVGTSENRGNPESHPFLGSWIEKGATLPPEDVDSDGDGFDDQDELRNDGDPNDPMVVPGEYECPTGPSPEFGCARVAPQEPRLDWSALLAAVFVAGVMVARFRRTPSA